MTKRRPDDSPKPPNPITVNVTVTTPERTPTPFGKILAYAGSGLLLCGGLIGYVLAHGDVTVILRP